MGISMIGVTYEKDFTITGMLSDVPCLHGYS